MKKTLAFVLMAVLAFSLLAAGFAGVWDEDEPIMAEGDAADGPVIVDHEPFTIGFSQIGAESAWRTANTNSVNAAADADPNITLKFSDAQGKQENQITAIKSFIDQDVDIIGFVPIAETGWDMILKEAREAEIPVMIMDRDVKLEEGAEEEGELYVCKIGTDMVEEGKKVFEWVDGYMAESGKAPRDGGDAFNIAILEGQVGSSAAVGREEGFSAAMAASPNADKFNILLSQTAEFDRATGMEVMESFMKSDGDKIDILFAHNDDMALGAMQAIEDAGVKPGEDIVVVAIDATNAGFEAMIEGKINCLVECNPLQGQLMMETAIKILNGEEVPKQVYMIDEVFPMEVAEEVLPTRQY